MSVNPYAIPTTISEVTSLDDEAYRIASQGQRLVNMIVDNIAVQVLSLALGMVIGVIAQVVWADANGYLSAEAAEMLDWVALLFGFLLGFGYYAVWECYSQRTLGKLLTRTRVVNIDGSRPTLGQILGRSVVRCIPFEPFSFLLGRNPVGWHDSWTRTRVISLR